MTLDQAVEDIAPLQAHNLSKERSQSSSNAVRIEEQILVKVITLRSLQRNPEQIANQLPPQKDIFI